MLPQLTLSRRTLVRSPNKRVNLIRSRSGGGSPGQTAHRLRAVR